MDEPTVRKKLFEIYTERPESLEEPEETSLAKYFELEFQKLIKKYPDEYKKACELPAMVNIARSHNHKGIVVFLRADDYYRLRWINYEGKILSANDWDILKILECGAEEVSENFNTGYFTIVNKVKEDFENEANRRERDKEEITDPVKMEFKKLIDWLKRKESKEVKARLDKLFDFVWNKHLNYYHSKLIRKVTRNYKKKFGLKAKEVLEELEKTIYPELENALPVVRTKIEPKYAQIIIAEELR